MLLCVDHVFSGLRCLTFGQHLNASHGQPRGAELLQSFQGGFGLRSKHQDQEAAIGPLDQVVQATGLSLAPLETHVLNGRAAVFAANAGAAVGVGNGHAACVHQGTCKRVLLGQADGGCSKCAFNAIGMDSYVQPHRHLLDPKAETLPVTATVTAGQEIDLLASEHQIMAVGDDAQCIYSWRGANFKNILDFPKRYPGAQVFKIETNYRSAPDILDVAKMETGEITVVDEEVGFKAILEDAALKKDVFRTLDGILPRAARALVDEHEVHVRRVVQLGPPELAQPDDGESASDHAPARLHEHAPHTARADDARPAPDAAADAARLTMTGPAGAYDGVERRRSHRA